MSPLSRLLDKRPLHARSSCLRPACQQLHSLVLGFCGWLDQLHVRHTLLPLQVLHLLLLELLKQPHDHALLEFMRVDEMLIDIGDDLTDYEEDVAHNSFNIFRGK